MSRLHAQFCPCLCASLCFYPKFNFPGNSSLTFTERHERIRERAEQFDDQRQRADSQRQLQSAGQLSGSGALFNKDFRKRGVNNQPGLGIFNPDSLVRQPLGSSLACRWICVAASAFDTGQFCLAPFASS